MFVCIVAVARVLRAMISSNPIIRHIQSIERILLRQGMPKVLLEWLACTTQTQKGVQRVGTRRSESESVVNYHVRREQRSYLEAEVEHFMAHSHEHRSMLMQFGKSSQLRRMISSKTSCLSQG